MKHYVKGNMKSVNCFLAAWDGGTFAEEEETVLLDVYWSCLYINTSVNTAPFLTLLLEAVIFKEAYVGIEMGQKWSNIITRRAAIFWVSATCQSWFQEPLCVIGTYSSQHSEQTGDCCCPHYINNGRDGRWSVRAARGQDLKSCSSPLYYLQLFHPMIPGLVSGRFLQIVFVKWTLGGKDWALSKPTSAFLIIHPGKSIGCRTGCIFWDDQKTFAKMALAFWLDFGA